MTTEERIGERLDWAGSDLHAFGQPVIDAVVAVMAVHASRLSPTDYGERLVYGFCVDSDEEPEPYPCETVRVIAEALGCAS